MASQAVKQRNTISLKGSAQIVSEFFNYAVNRSVQGLKLIPCITECHRARAAASYAAAWRNGAAAATAAARGALLLARCCSSVANAPSHALPLLPSSAPSILYQRGIYPQETFYQKKNYGLAMMVTKDDGLLAYLTNVTKQMTGGCCACCGVCWVCVGVCDCARCGACCERAVVHVCVRRERERVRFAAAAQARL
jgi:hypothetical protein